MPGNIRRLSELLSEVWDRTHHIFPASASRRLVQWLALSDSLVVQDDPSNIGVESIPYPAIWASGAADIYWGRGVWSPIAYSYCRTITVDHTKVPGGLADYPFLFNETIAELATVANGGHVVNTASGGASGSYTVPADLIFSPNTDGSDPYDFEVEKYDAATGELVAWVRLPTLASDADTVLYILYGRSSVTTSQENITGVWDGNFEAVYHLAETSGTFYDSTGNHDGTDAVSAAGKDGQIGNGQEFDKTDDRISMDAMGGLQDFTYEAWVRPVDVVGDKMMIQTGNGFFRVNDDDVYIGVWDGRAGTGASHEVTVAETLIAGTWVRLMLTVTAAEYCIVYKNGSSIYGATPGTGSSGSTYNNGKLGCRHRTSPSSDFYDWFGGEQDEVRISKVVRSANYDLATYNNQYSPSTFYTVGAE